MKVESLGIQLPQYGTNAGNYEGRVKLVGDNGEMTVNLSPGAIGRIFAVVQSEVAVQAKRNADLVQQSVENAKNATALIGHTIEV